MGIPDARFQLRSNPDKVAFSAPNGRIILCIPPSNNNALIDSSKEGYPPLLIVESLSISESLEFSLRYFTQSEISEILSANSLTFEAEKSHLMVDIRDKNGVAIPGVDLVLEEIDAVHFTRTPNGNISWDQESNGPLFFFPNLISQNVQIQITPPSGITCRGAFSATLEAGITSFHRFICESD